MGMFRTIIFFVLLAAIAWTLVHFAGLQASLMWTAIIGATAWLIRSHIEQKREYQRLLADRKRELYLQFLEFMAKFLASTEKGLPVQGYKKGKSFQQPVSLEEFRMWSLRLTLIGSDDVVLAWNKARQDEPTEEEEHPAATMKRWGKLWLEMRKDSGHVDTKLTVSDVLATFINDVEQHRAFLDKKD